MASFILDRWISVRRLASRRRAGRGSIPAIVLGLAAVLIIMAAEAPASAQNQRIEVDANAVAALGEGLPEELRPQYIQRLRKMAKMQWDHQQAQLGREPSTPPRDWIEHTMVVYDHHRREHGHLPHPQYHTSIGLRIPPPLGDADMERYASTLVLGDAQRAHLDRLYEAYRARDFVFRFDTTQSLWDRAAEIASNRPPHRTLASAREAVELFKAADRAIEQILLIEDRMFDELAPYLAEVQIPLLELVANQRRRRVYALVHTMYPASMVDLSLMLYEIEQERGMPTRPEDPAAFGALMAEYDDTLTALDRQRYDAATRHTDESLLITGEHHELIFTAEDREAVRPRLTELEERRLALIRPRFQASKRIYELNRQYVDLLSAELPDPVAVELQRRFRETTYRPIYPNPYDVEPELRELLSIDSLNGDQREDLEGVIAAFVEQRRELDRRMIERCMAWKDETARREGYNVLAWEVYRDEMQELQAKRFAAAVEHLELARGALTSAQLIDLGRRFPKVVKETVEIDERELAWMRQRFPDNPQRIKAWLQQKQMHRGGTLWPGPYD